MRITNNRILHSIYQFLLLTVGAAIYACGVSFLVDPNNIAPGGVTGIAILLSRIVPMLPGTIILLINIPLLVIAFFRFKLRFTLSTVYTTLLTSTLINNIPTIFPAHVPLTNNYMLAAIIGGAVIAVGMGLVFHGGACTGGTDIVVKLLRQRFKQFKSGVLFFTMDAIIITFSVFAAGFGIESALYASICVFVTAFVLDFVLYGPEGAKVVYIISEVPDRISQRIMNEMDCGVTFLEGQGGYTGAKQRVVMCAFHKHLYTRVRDVVSSEDPKAFMIVSSAHEVFGEGFKNPFADEM